MTKNEKGEQVRIIDWDKVRSFEELRLLLSWLLASSTFTGDRPEWAAIAHLLRDPPPPPTITLYLNPGGKN